MKYSWPDYFPTQCPPNNAKAKNATLYRMVKNDPPLPKDFLCHRLLYKNIDFDDPCEASGLSTYSTMEGARKLQEAVPKFRKYKIATGNIKPDNGVVLETSSNNNSDHITWWVALSTMPEKLFNIKS